MKMSWVHVEIPDFDYRFGIIANITIWAQQSHGSS